MKPPARVCPDGCQGSGDALPTLSEDGVQHALDELRSPAPEAEAVGRDDEAEEAAWQLARTRLYGERRRRERAR